MSKPISQNVPDAEKLISLTSEELAGYLLEHLHSNIINRRQRFQSENIAAEISRGEYSPTYAEKVSDAVKRGYADNIKAKVDAAYEKRCADPEGID